MVSVSYIVYTKLESNLATYVTMDICTAHCLRTCVYNDYSFGSPTHSVCVKVIGCVQLVRLSFNISVNI